MRLIGLLMTLIACPSFADWSVWYDRDDPSGTGDWEHLYQLQIDDPDLCERPTAVECRAIDGTPLSVTREVVICSTEDGFICRNQRQPDGRCDYDYKVRFLCE